MGNSLTGVELRKTEAELYNFLIGYSVAEPNYGYGQSGGSELTAILVQNLDLTSYVNRLQTIFELYERLDRQEEWNLLCNVVEVCLSYTPNIGIDFHKGEKVATLYPQGAELLDKGIINGTLFWLEAHPKVLQHFDVALKLYMEGDKAKQRSLRDELRFSMEQLLKEVLQNNKPIEKQGNALKMWLKLKGAHPQVVNLYGQLLFHGYTNYQNDVKHTGEYREQDVEFVIYLTGTFMRQLLQLERVG